MPAPQTLSLETDLPVVMRDGVTLRGELIRPAGPGPYPTLIVRNPYGPEVGFLAGRFNPLSAVKRGYAVLLQDCRGCFSSDGDFYPFHQEQADGYDTVEWAAAQPWSDGNVGVSGASYLGCTTWQAALAAPPHLKAVAPASTASDYRDGWVYQGNALLLDFAPGWGLGVKALRLRDQGLAPEELAVLGLLVNRPATLEAFYAALAGGSVSGDPSSTAPTLGYVMVWRADGWPWS